MAEPLEKGGKPTFAVVDYTCTLTAWDNDARRIRSNQSLRDVFGSRSWHNVTYSFVHDRDWETARSEIAIKLLHAHKHADKHAFTSQREFYEFITEPCPGPDEEELKARERFAKYSNMFGIIGAMFAASSAMYKPWMCPCGEAMYSK